jgi:hypothetical protein
VAGMNLCQCGDQFGEAGGKRDVKEIAHAAIIVEEVLCVSRAGGSLAVSW